MKIEIIYTFETLGQVTKSFPFVLPIVSDKTTFIDFCYRGISPDQQDNLIKMSCCIYLQERLSIREPKWYKECNGKIWIDDLQEYRNRFSFPSKVSQDYITEFSTNNQ